MSDLGVTVNSGKKPAPASISSGAWVSRLRSSVMHEESDGLDPVTGVAQGIVAMDSIRISGDEAMVVLLNQLPVSMTSRGIASDHCAFDVWLIDPERSVCFRNRPVNAVELSELADLLQLAMQTQTRLEFRSTAGGFGLVVIPLRHEVDQLVIQVDVEPALRSHGRDTSRFVFATTRPAIQDAARVARRNAEAARAATRQGSMPTLGGNALWPSSARRRH